MDPRYQWEMGFDRALDYTPWVPDFSLPQYDFPDIDLGATEGFRFDADYGAPDGYSYASGPTGVDPDRILSSGPKSGSYQPGTSFRSQLTSLFPASIGETSSLITSFLRTGFQNTQPNLETFQPSIGSTSTSFGTFKPDYGTGSLSTALQRLMNPQRRQPPEQTAPAQGGSYGSATAVGGDWSALDAHNVEINLAAQATGVPANLLKAMINRESSGNWSANNRVHYARNSRMLPFVGVFEAAAQDIGMNFDEMIGNKQLQINAMAMILARDYARFGSWEAAASFYLTGDPNAWQTGGSDPEGTITAGYYVNRAMEDWQYLDGRAGASGPSGGWFNSSLWGGGNFPVTYEFKAGGSSSAYAYGSAHGTNGSDHPGIDVGVPRGTTLYTPKAGVVSCVGTASAGIGGTGGGSCGYFTDNQGGIGNVTVKFDDGTFLVFGHSSKSLVQVGQRVEAGDAISLSGTQNGDHVHFEYRVPGPCSSKFCVQDPRGITGGTTGTGTAPQQGGSSISQRLWFY